MPHIYTDTMSTPTKTIHIDFNDDGTISMEGHGFAGKECDAAMRAYEAGLGTIKGRTNKAEYAKATVKVAQRTKLRN